MADQAPLGTAHYWIRQDVYRFLNPQFAFGASGLRCNRWLAVHAYLARGWRSSSQLWPAAAHRARVLHSFV